MNTFFQSSRPQHLQSRKLSISIRKPKSAKFTIIERKKRRLKIVAKFPFLTIISMPRKNATMLLAKQVRKLLRRNSAKFLQMGSTNQVIFKTI